jgi:sterol desaturase/sphingolipid hydroxylase (fatty acid hydroxylase superfamily)
MSIRENGVTDESLPAVAVGREEEESMTLPVGRSWGAFVLATVEAVCVFYVGAAQAGLLVGSFAAGALGVANFIHREIFRVPILLAAIVGAALNLYLMWNAQRLRNAPAAAWRKRPLTGRERWRIGLVLGLSLATFAIAAGEIVLHRRSHHTIM